MGVYSSRYTTGDGRLPQKKKRFTPGAWPWQPGVGAEGFILSTIRAPRSSVCTASRVAAGVGEYIRWSGVSEVRKLLEVIYRLLETFRPSSGASSKGPLLQ